MGNVDLWLLLFLVVGSLPGVYMGSQIGTKLSPKVIQPIMGSLLLAIGMRFMLAG